MDEIKNYVDILIHTLEKKIELLEKIEGIAILQTKTLDSDNIEAEKIMNQLEQKDVYLKELEKLDEGFETVYERAGEKINENRTEYEEEIKKMQVMIKEIASYTVKLQVYEEKNRPRFVTLFESKRKEVKKFKINKKLASSYYKNMANAHQDGQSYFLDKKK